MINGLRYEDEMKMYREIWNSETHQSTKQCIWKFMKGRLAVKSLFKGISEAEKMCICKKHEETQQHLFFECHITNPLWNDVIRWWR